MVDIRDVITCFKFGDDRFRGLALAEGQILPFPVDFDGRPYNTTLWACDYRIEKNEAFPLMKYIRRYVYNWPLIILVIA